MLAREKIVHYLDLAIYYGFHFLVFSIPLVFLPTISYDPFDLVKVTLLRILTLVIFAGWLIKQLFSEQIIIRRTKLDLPILIFLILAMVSTFTSIHPLTSIFGKYRRFEGILTLINYGLIFFLAAQIFSHQRRWQALRETMILGALPVVIYGLFQYLGYDPFQWSGEFFEQFRSFATLANPVLLAGYLVLILPLIVSCYYESTKPYQLFFYGGAFLLTLASTITTFSRGGWLAALVGLIALSLLLGRRIIFSKKTAFLALTLILLFLAVLAINYQQVLSLPEKTLSLSERVSSLTTIGEGSIYSRLLIWQSALKMIKSRPLFGWGVDTFRLAFPSFASLKYAQAEGKASIPDNAHNYFLQLATTTGILGLLAFLVILVIFFWQQFRFYLGSGKVYSASWRASSPTTTSGFLAAVIGYLTHLLFGINVIGSGTIFWIILALLSPVRPEARYGNLKVSATTYWPYRILAVILILFLAAGFSWFSLKPLLADIHFARAQRLRAQGYLDSAIKEYNSARQLNPYLDLYPAYLGVFYRELAWQIGSPYFFDRAVDAFLHAQKASPLELDHTVLLGNVYLLGGQRFSRTHYPLAERQLRSIIKRAPYWVEARYDLGVTYFETDRFQKAASEFKAVLKIDSQDTQAYLYLGKSYEALGNFSKASQAYQSVLKLEPANEQAREGLGRTEVR